MGERSLEKSDDPSPRTEGPTRRKAAADSRPRGFRQALAFPRQAWPDRLGCSESAPRSTAAETSGQKPRQRARARSERRRWQKPSARPALPLPVTEGAKRTNRSLLSPHVVLGAYGKPSQIVLHA